MTDHQDRLHIINGPNLNLLGEREPEHYGAATLSQIEERCAARCTEHGFGMVFQQTNGEGELVDFIQEASRSAWGVVLNPAGYSHTSVAVLDAVRACRCPVVEVHLSNPHRRETYRRRLLTAQAAAASISGLGVQSYLLAIDALANMPESRKLERT